MIRDQKQSRITFTPRSNNRLRCNWNGDVISRKQSKAAYNRRWSELHPPEHTNHFRKARETVCDQAYRVETAAIERDGSHVKCPYCKSPTSLNSAIPLAQGRVRCGGCHKEFDLKSAPALLTAEWKPFFKRSAYGQVKCPHCTYLLDDKQKGEVYCTSCNSDFLAVEAETEAAPTKPTTETVQAHNTWGDVTCPNCTDTFLDTVKKGKNVEVTCDCGHKFIATPYNDD